MHDSLDIDAIRPFHVGFTLYRMASTRYQWSFASPAAIESVN